MSNTKGFDVKSRLMKMNENFTICSKTYTLRKIWNREYLARFRNV